MAFINFYKILHISTRATTQEIKRAYRHMAKIWHPDRNHGSQVSEEKFKEIQSAYEVLSNPNKKKNYDRKFQKELAKDQAERNAPPPRKKDFRWQSAQSYQSQLNNLWQQYETLNKDRKRAFGQGYTQKKEKYYYYNNERISAEEFRAKAQKTHNPSNPKKEEGSPASIHYIDPFKKDIPWWQQVEIIGMWGLFLNLVFFMLYPQQMGFSTLLPVLVLGGLITFIKWSQHRNPLHNLVIEIRPDCIIRRGKGSLETTLYFDEIKSIQDLNIGLYLGTQTLPNTSPFSRRLATAHEDIIFIPIAIQNFEGIRRFLLSLEPDKMSV